MAGIPQFKLNTGAAMPGMGFGTWHLAEGREVIESVQAALKTGYRLIDTAMIYGNETGVGEVVRSSKIPREEIFITTKLWPGDFGYESAIEAFEGSMRRLNLDYIDLYLIHWPGQDVRRRHQAWEALTELYNQGQTKAVGVSNFMVGELEDLLSDSGLVPAVNQIEFHPFVYAEYEGVLEFCKRNDIVIEAYSPLAMGRQIDHPRISAIADKIGKTNAQVMLRWAVQHGTVPIPRSRQPRHIHDNFQLFDFELSDKDMTALDSLGG